MSRAVTTALAVLFLAPFAGSAGAQAVDTAAAVRALARFEATCAEPGAEIWGRPLCAPVVLVHARTRTAVANRPDPDGHFAPHGSAWVGPLPAGMLTANTSVEWGGERWAMVLLPLPADEFQRLALIAHEAFHTIQPELGLAARDAPAPHLDLEQGRLWLRLELRALAAALREEGAAGRAALADALRFRAHRHALHPGADTLEARLEVHEGLAEYTGARFAISVLGGGFDPVIRAMERLERAPTFVRSLGYGTGPALGLLLDRHAPSWRERAAERPLAVLLAEAIGSTAAAAPASAEVVAGAERFGYAQVAAEESQRATVAAARLEDIRARLLAGPVLVLEQDALRASFDPNALVPLPGQGSYYPTGTFHAEWGTLTVTTGGALVAPDWRTLLVPAAAALREGRPVEGDGWTLDLAEGWSMVRVPGIGWKVRRER